MKKRIVALILVLSLLSILAACGGGQQKELGTTSPSETTAPISDNPLIAAELERCSVMNGAGTEVIGVFGVVHISKSELNKITLEQYAEFCEEIVDGRDGDIYNWISIMCEDGTGIQFFSAQSAIASYGTMDADGCIIEELGDITKIDGSFVYKDLTAPEPTQEPSSLTVCPEGIEEKYVSLAQELQGILFTTKGSENGLAGTIYWIEGIVKEVETIDYGDNFVAEEAKVETAMGTVRVANWHKAYYDQIVAKYGKNDADKYFVDSTEKYVLPEVGETVQIIAVYAGFSDLYKLPMFYFGANHMLFVAGELEDPTAQILEESDICVIGNLNFPLPIQPCVEDESGTHTILISSSDSEILLAIVYAAESDFEGDFFNAEVYAQRKQFEGIIDGYLNKTEIVRTMLNFTMEGVSGTTKSEGGSENYCEVFTFTDGQYIYTLVLQCVSDEAVNDGKCFDAYIDGIQYK